MTLLRNALPGNGQLRLQGDPVTDKMMALEPARCGWIKRRENAIAPGLPGTGKTHVALGLGLDACQKGMPPLGHGALERAC